MKPTTGDKRIYFLYARKSSESEDRQVQSIEDQITRLRELAQAHHLEIKEIFMESKTAKMPYCRPIFSDMISRIEKGEAQGIICWEMNRLFRNPVDQGTVSWLLQRSVIKSIHTIEREFLPEDNVLLLNVIGGMANQYIIDLARNSRRGMIGKAERGWLPAVPPLGYVNDLIEKTITVDQERFSLIRKMWDLMLTGQYTPRQIRRIANNEWGFRTPKHKRTGGNELSNGLIYKLFSNIFYTGMFMWDNKLYKGNHAPMVTFGEFDRVQVLLGRKGRPRAKRHNFPYTGFIECAICGCMITATEKIKYIKSTGLYKTYIYYHCSRKSKIIKCENKPILSFELEKIFVEDFEKYTISNDFLEIGLKMLVEEKNERSADSATISLTRQKSLNDAQNEMNNLTRMRYKQMIDDDIFIKERDLLRNTITRLQAEVERNLDYSHKWTELSERALNFAAHVQANFQDGTVDRKKEICMAFGSNYKLKDKELIYDKAVWLVPLKKAFLEEVLEKCPVEPDKKPIISTWNTEIQTILLHWRAKVNEVRTAIEKLNNPDLHIPDLSGSEIIQPQEEDKI